MLGWIENTPAEENQEKNALQEAEAMQSASRQKVLLYIVGKNVEQACVAALEIIDRKCQLVLHDDLDGFASVNEADIYAAIDVLELVQEVQITRVAKDLKMRVICYSALLGVIKAIWYGN